jgi:hypothetical protein
LLLLAPWSFTFGLLGLRDMDTMMLMGMSIRRSIRRRVRR